MGVPAEKATTAAVRAQEDLQYILEVLTADGGDIFQEGRHALDECRRLLDGIERIRFGRYHDRDE